MHRETWTEWLKIVRNYRSPVSNLRDCRDENPGERVYRTCLLICPAFRPRLLVYFLSNFRFLVCRSPMTFDKYFTCCRYRRERRLSPRLRCRSSSVSKGAHIPSSIRILQFLVFARIRSLEFFAFNSFRFYFTRTAFDFVISFLFL